MIGLAQRAVVCPQWRWLGGEMQLVNEGSGWRRHRRIAPSPTVGAIPDLSDPATLGCLLALVREAWGDVVDTEEWYTPSREHRFTVTIHHGGTLVEFEGASFGGALVAALEAAP